MKSKTTITIVCIAILTIILAYTIFTVIVNRQTPLPVILTDPETIVRATGQDFTINVTLLNVTDLYGWQVKLGLNMTILNVTSITEGTFLKNHGSTTFNYTINATGYIWMYCTLLGDVSGVNGTGVLATLQFHVMEEGNCDLNLYDTMLVSFSEQLIAHTVRDGHFST